MKRLVFASAGALVAFVAGPAGAQSGPTPAQKDRAAIVREACRADYARFCDGVRPGGGRILACFEAHAADLSPDCRKAIEAVRAAGR